ncbi:MAG: alpha/beta fold hydrolase, partial [Janthinobacterium sp.]
MKSTRQDFPGAHGHVLAARLDAPDGAIRAYALFAHCFTCGKDVLAARRIAQGLTEHGIAVLRFDFTGLGASEGEFSATNFTSNVADLVAAADFLRARHSAPQLLIGHSLGGAAVLAAASHVPEATAIATLAAPSTPAYVTRMFSDHLEQIAAEGEALVRLEGRPFRIRQQFVDDAGSH